MAVLQEGTKCPYKQKRGHGAFGETEYWDIFVGYSNCKACKNFKGYKGSDIVCNYEKKDLLKMIEGL